MAVVRVQTDLPIPAKVAFELAQKPALLLHVMRPWVGVRGQLPEHLEAGEEVGARLYFFGVLPAWKHTIRLVSLRPYEIYSNERGGPVAAWNHQLTFEETSENTCHYTDEVEIRAGLSTPLVVAFAQFMYRWRQRRWRAIARVLA